VGHTPADWRPQPLRRFRDEVVDYILRHPRVSNQELAGDVRGRFPLLAVFTDTQFAARRRKLVAKAKAKAATEKADEGERGDE
jgi:hypothetical protein